MSVTLVCIKNKPVNVKDGNIDYPWIGNAETVDGAFAHWARTKARVRVRVASIDAPGCDLPPGPVALIDAVGDWSERISCPASFKGPSTALDVKAVEYSNPWVAVAAVLLIVAGLAYIVSKGE